MPETPLLITETGTAGDNTKPEIVEARRNYYQLSLQAVSEAQAKGVNVIGYLAWTLFDNFEWNHGYSPAHGFGVIRRAKHEQRYEKTAAYHLLAAIFATGRYERLQFAGLQPFDDQGIRAALAGNYRVERQDSRGVFFRLRRAGTLVP